MQTEDKQEWTRIISAKSKGISLGFKDVYQYRDLVFLFMRRDTVAIYKQTVLGPLWLVLQPLITSVAFAVIFGNLVGVSTSGYPKFLFYYSGLVFWSLFAESFQKTSDTFISNADLFSKVFFPRLVIPFSILFTSLVKFSFSFLIFIMIWIWYIYQGEIIIQSWVQLLWLPVLCLLMALLGMAFGLVFSAITVRYRDLRFLIQFGIQLLMYFSPVIFPLSIVEGKLEKLISCNPVSGIIEASRSIFLSGSMPDLYLLSISFSITLITLFIGLIIFSRVQRNFIDTL
jgi:lipopolysaccharide transport system permease protein